MTESEIADTDQHHRSFALPREDHPLFKTLEVRLAEIARDRQAGGQWADKKFLSKTWVKLWRDAGYNGEISLNRLSGTWVNRFRIKYGLRKKDAKARLAQSLPSGPAPSSTSSFASISPSSSLTEEPVVEMMPKHVVDPTLTYVHTSAPRSSAPVPIVSVPSTEERNEIARFLVEADSFFEKCGEDYRDCREHISQCGLKFMQKELLRRS